MTGVQFKNSKLNMYLVDDIDERVHDPDDDRWACQSQSTHPIQSRIVESYVRFNRHRNRTMETNVSYL